MNRATGTATATRFLRVPGVTMVRDYRRRWLRTDLLAGITVTAYLVPQVMAYATVAGLPPVVGLWTIIPCLLVYALFGSSRLMSIGPESTTALMSAATVGPLAQGDAARYAVLSAALAVMVGLLALAAWLLRLGFVADLLSRPVLIGYMAGVAALMISGYGRMAVMAAKECVNKAFEGTLADGVMFERRLFHALFATADQKEGMDAFVYKRQAVFKNQ